VATKKGKAYMKTIAINAFYKNDTKDGIGIKIGSYAVDESLDDVAKTIDDASKYKRICSTNS
jgi:hypothetical protein